MAEASKSPNEVRRQNYNVTCQRCNKPVSGWVAYDKDDLVVDSGNFTIVEFGASNFNLGKCICDACTIEVTGQDGTQEADPDNLEETTEWMAQMWEKLP